MKRRFHLIWVVAIVISSAPAFGQTCSTGEYQRPIPLGISGGNIDCVNRRCCTSGTLGALVQDGSGNQYILSNNHVLARSRSGKNRRAIGEPIVQPGLVDAAPVCAKNPQTAVANLSRWVPIRFGHKNLVDAAIAQTISGDVDSSGTIENIGAISGTIVPSGSVTLNMQVQKTGRTTCLTSGSVVALDVTVRVRYPRICGLVGGGAARFLHQIIIGDSLPFSASGDSGSLVVTREGCPRAVGLLFADGTDQQGNSLTVINPIDQVLSALNVSMVGGCSSATQSAIAQNSASTAHTQSSASPTQTPDFQQAMARARSVKQRHEDELMAIPGVVGIGIGRSSNSMPVIVVFVNSSGRQVASKIPSQVDGVPVETRQTGEFKAL